MEVYLDNSATTEVSPEAAKKAREAMELVWGNPSSLHSRGLDAERLVLEARENILRSLGITDRSAAKFGRLVFTGSGTEADNLAIFGTAHAKAQSRGGRIITTDSEHPAVLESRKALESEGFDVVYIRSRGGVLDMEQYMNALTPRTVIVSIMAVNNETGAAYDIKSAFDAAHKLSPDIVTHTDAVQAYSHIPFSPDRLGADLVTISGHKIHAPKGTGALIIRPELLKAKRIVPILRGGGQENGLRSGTENVPGIAGFGAAAAEITPARISKDLGHFSELREYLMRRLPDGVRVNTPEGKYAPHIISLTLPKIKSESMLNFLSGRGIYVSSGSACSSHGKKGSHVLAAFGLPLSEADCTIRVSLGRSTSKEMLGVFTDALAEGCRTLVKMN